LVVWIGVTVGVFSFNLLPDAIAFVAVSIYLVLGIGSQGYRYFRRSDAVQRQQTKWVFFALGLVVLTGVWAIVNLALTGLGPPDPQLTVDDLWFSLISTTLFSLSLSALPISIGIAILRYRLWDIDVIIRKTLVYSVLTVLLALVYFGIVVLLQALFGRLAGVEQSTLAVVISTLAIAALFTPLRRRIQDAIDRRFFRKKYNAQQVLAQFAVTARDETDLDALLAELVRVVDETLQPEHVSVWLTPSGRNSEAVQR
jgi:low affinity Fe/Cu permease